MDKRVLRRWLAIGAAMAALSAPLAPTVAAAAQPYSFQTVPFGAGGFVDGFVYHPKQKDILYARTDIGGMYRFDFANRRWIPLLDHLGHDDADLMGVLAIAVDPNKPDKVYAACGLYLGQWARKGHLAFSDDQGKTWQQTVLTSAGVNDHQTLVSGVEPKGVPIPLTDPAYQKVLYYCVNGVAEGSCVRSFDGGQTFTQANQTGYQAFNAEYLASFDEKHNEGICGSLHGHAVTDTQGRLFIPRGYCQIPMIAISSDAATTFHDVQVAKDVSMSGQQASVAVDRKGNLYYVWQDAKYNLPYLAVSRDHGEHWSTPLMIAPPGVHEVDFPTIDVGDPGRVAITFPGTTSTGGSKDKTRPWNSYVVVSTDALAHNPLFLSNIANPKWDPVHRGDCNGRCGRMYDFLDVVSSPRDQGRVFATEVDTCTAYLSCNRKRVAGENDDDVIQYELGNTHGAANDMQAVIIREVSGPALRGPARWITRDSAR